MSDLQGTINCYLRKATPTDSDILFEWVNDQLVRQSAFDTHTITYDEHKVWFGRMLNDPDQIQYILMEGETPIGQIRLIVDGENAEVDYSISNKARRFGYGQEIIRLAIEKIRNDYPNIKKLIGRIKPSNAASYHCFIRNGFEEVFQQLEYEIQEASNHSIYAGSQNARGGGKNTVSYEQ